eukprot:4629653-Alexandrium_andersonii.AAC.1
MHTALHVAPSCQHGVCQALQKHVAVNADSTLFLWLGGRPGRSVTGSQAALFEGRAPAAIEAKTVRRCCAEGLPHGNVQWLNCRS